MAFSAHFDHKICKETEQRTDRKTVTMRPVDRVCLCFERLLILSISTFELCKYCIYTFGVGKILKKCFLKSVLCSPRLHLFIKNKYSKTSDIMKYYKNIYYFYQCLKHLFAAGSINIFSYRGLIMFFYLFMCKIKPVVNII